MEQSDRAYALIEPQLPHFTGDVFEEICKQYLWRLLKEGRFVEFTDLGRWWGSNPNTKTQVEIDIMGAGDKETALFCECKWTNEKVNLPVLETLITRGELFEFKHKHFYVFVKTGFTTGCIAKAAERGNVTLVGFEDMSSKQVRLSKN